MWNLKERCWRAWQWSPCLENQSGAISLQWTYWFTFWSFWFFDLSSLMKSIQFCFWIAVEFWCIWSKTCFPLGCVLFLTPNLAVSCMLAIKIGYVHTAGKCGPNLFYFFLPTRDSDLFLPWQCEPHKLHGIWYFQFWFVPLPYVVLNPIHVRCFAMQLQCERTYRISCGFYVTLDWHSS